MLQDKDARAREIPNMQIPDNGRTDALRGATYGKTRIEATRIGVSRWRCSVSSKQPPLEAPGHWRGEAIVALPSFAAIRITP